MPGGIVCSIATCKNNSKKARERGETLMFLNFPKDPLIRKEWIKKCKRKDKSWDAEHKRICSKHFNPEDFEDELRARLLNLKPKKLKKDAIPSLYLLSNEIKQEISERSQRMVKKERKQIVDELIKRSLTPPPPPLPSPPPLLEITIKQENIEIEETRDQNEITELDIFKDSFKSLKNENILLKEKIEYLENNQNNLQQHICKLEQQIKTDEIRFENRVKDAFKDFLTPNQVEIALKKKSSAHWTTEEFSKAFTLRYFSKRAYIYLRETLHYPLPGVTTLQKWAANLNVTNGILNDVLPIMGTAGQAKTNLSKVTVISFDEIKVSSLYEYCGNEDEVMGPHSNMLVIMARGLFDNWKQPVYIGFDQKMTKELLKNIIVQLHEINFNVVACVSDCGIANQGLWKAIDVSMNSTFIAHPVTMKPVYFFADVPHLLKSLRNWFVDTGFVLSSGVKINKDPVECLIDNTTLTALHLSYETGRKYNVRIAAELFSTDLTHLTGDAAEDMVNFFQLINNWFDLMNSKPYGVNLSTQNEVLDLMSVVVEGMVCTGKKNLQVFQKGIIMSITSLKGLYASMKEDYDIEYILTHRLNQDCLENLFAQMKMGAALHDHPSPLNAIHTVRSILLGKSQKQTSSNVEETSTGLQDDYYLLASALKQAKLGNIKITQPETHKKIEI